ncbi:hypothetical protein CDL12_28223 [Handroanthus impetiginosus]|uniref:Late embryogenesis abundant protein LEA-2 subgroup domain-containing protein n=1 Tax=Handroanthus impetiginosus TaxID=429701 RepID=A0A2G9G309_9LAMI|nr:hypothetical protein CDL12_28223 [Handroanthus impetiginosus]
MAEKYQQQSQGYPLAPATIVPRSDEEHATNYQSQQQIMKKRKRMKCLAYIAFFAVFQTIVIAVFALTVMRVKTPKVRLEDVSVTNNNGNLRFAAQVVVRNRNFARYKFDSSLATVRSENNNVGEFAIPDSRVRARSTKKMYVVADLSISNTTNSGVLGLSIEGRLRGKVELLRVIKRNNSAEMNCTMSINLATSPVSVQDLSCK